MPHAAQIPTGEMLLSVGGGAGDGLKRENPFGHGPKGF